MRQDHTGPRAGRGQPSAFFDLETPSDRAKLREPEVLLGGLKGLVVIDEVQRMPELFTVLRPLADRPEPSARFLLLGSASPELVRGVRAWIVHPGEASYPVHEKVMVCPLPAILEELG